MQGGPGVFKGDLHFNSADGDVSDRLREIDADRCPVFMLTGEYDHSCTPKASQGTAALIDGADLNIMDGSGHFPMSENPAAFRNHLLPISEKIQNIR